MTPDQLFDYLLLALAAGRLAYAITQDEIFRPVRQYIWLRSAPVHGMYRLHGEDVLASKIDRWKTTEEERQRGLPKWEMDYIEGSRRAPGFLGQLFECAYCMSFWTSAALLGSYLAWPTATIAFSSLVALWAAANTYAAKGL